MHAKLLSVFFEKYRRARARNRILIPAVILGVLAALAGPAIVAQATDPCGAGSNPIVCENSQPGTPMSQWVMFDERTQGRWLALAQEAAGFVANPRWRP